SGRRPTSRAAGQLSDAGGDSPAVGRAASDSSPAGIESGRGGGPEASNGGGASEHAQRSGDAGAVNASPSAPSVAPNLHALLDAVAAQAMAALKVTSSAAWIGEAGVASGLATEAGAAIVEAARRIVRGPSGVATVVDWETPPQGVSAGEAGLF